DALRQNVEQRLEIEDRQVENGQQHKGDPGQPHQSRLHGDHLPAEGRPWRRGRAGSKRTAAPPSMSGCRSCYLATQLFQRTVSSSTWSAQNSSSPKKASARLSPAGMSFSTSGAINAAAALFVVP